MTKRQENAKEGHPTLYSAELAAAICAGLAEGRSLRAVCNDDDMPAMSTVFLWLGQDDKAEFLEQYTRAREQRVDAMFEDMQEIADEARLDYVETRDKAGNPKLILNTENISRSKLRIETRQWMLARMAPKKYGDKMQVESKVDITNHYNEDDMKILERHARQFAEDKSKPRKPKPQEDNHE